MLHDQRIQLIGILRRTLEKFIRENSRAVRRFRRPPEFRLQLRWLLPAHVPLKQHLHRKLA